MNYSFGYVLRNIDTDELRYYHPSSNNAQVLDTAVTISNSNELEEFLRKIAAEDFFFFFYKVEITPDHEFGILPQSFGGCTSIRTRRVSRLFNA